MCAFEQTEKGMKFFMITTLHIKNIGIIDDITIDLNNGLNILTGETGAGKTLIIDSLSIIAGGRFSKDMIRKGQDHSFVEIGMYLPNNEMDLGENVVISREIYANGRNSCKINGRLVTVTELKNYMNNILNIHGQLDNQNLLNKEMHIKYLDSFAGTKLQQLKAKYRELYTKYNIIKNELKNNYGDEKEKQRKLDLLQYQLNEIEDAKLKKNEDDELEEKRKIINNSEKLSESLNIADIKIGDNALDYICTGIKNLEKIEDINEKYKNTLNSLKSVYYDLQEIARDINEYKEDVMFDEEERTEIENRLDLIFSLKRKYGNTIEEIINYKNEIEKELYTIQNLDEHNNKLKNELKLLEEAMYEICEKISVIRKKYGENLSKKVNSELVDLEMPNARFSVYIKPNIVFNKNGLDDIEFMMSTNIGEDDKPLSKIASGGEMSRIMLAIKTILSNVDEVNTLVFDEIDTGISGKAAKAVGEKLKMISNNHQVLVVTHQASIAAKGDYNYYIYKEINKNITNTKVKLLNDEEILKEIARISSGDITEISLKHAMELRKAI